MSDSHIYFQIRFNELVLSAGFPLDVRIARGFEETDITSMIAIDIEFPDKVEEITIVAISWLVHILDCHDSWGAGQPLVVVRKIDAESVFAAIQELLRCRGCI